MKRKRSFSLRVHGNYVGPGWSAGKWQPSVRASSVPAVDEFDETAKRHDFAYGAYKDDPKKLSEADYKFYKENIGKGFLRSASAVAVGIQGALRYVHSFLQKVFCMAPIRSRSRGRSSTRRSRSLSVPLGQRMPSRARSASSGQTRMPSVRMRSRSRTPQAPTMTKDVGFPINRGYGAKNSKSKGFFKRGRKVKSYLDRGTGGVEFCIESGGILAPTSGVDCQWVGHATATYANLLNDLSYALTKWVALKLNTTVTDFAQECKNDGDGYDIIGQGVPRNNLGVVDAFNQTIVVGTTTWATLANGIRTQLFTYLETYPYGVLTNLLIRRRNAPKEIENYDMRRARLTFKCKSSLKIQNRTINSAGNTEADEVDNVPLYGKSYEGNGNYIKYIPSGQFSAPFYSIIGTTSGTVVNTGFMQETFDKSQSMSEPPKASQLFNVSKNGKCHLDPAELKTSVIFHTITISLNTFFNKFRIQGTMVPETKLGNYRLFAFEKMLKTGPEATAATQMKIAYEVDEKRYCKISVPKSPVTNTVVNLLNA